MRIKIITLNVELNRHWETIIPFIEREAPDVICLQELFDRDAEMLADKFDYHYLHLPITNIAYTPKGTISFTPSGPGLFSKLPLSNPHAAYYYEAAPEIQIIKETSPAEHRATVHQGVVWGTIHKDGIPFTIATTHFSWTPNGLPNEDQEQDVVSLLETLRDIPDVILCGDFNMPRGDNNHIYQTLTQRFKDNIPPEIKTTIDLNKHRMGKDPIEGGKLATFVVDYIFSTPEYSVNNVRCEFGLSDHGALIATVTRLA